MSVVYFMAAFLVQRKTEDANYSDLIWLPPYNLISIIENMMKGETELINI